MSIIAEQQAGTPTDSDPDMDEALRRVRRQAAAVEEAFWRLVVPLAQEMPDDSDDVCPICLNWTCRCAK